MPLLPEDAAQWGGRPVARTVAEAAPRQRVVLTGIVVAVTDRRSRLLGGPVRMADARPYVDAVLDDGSGTITLRWLGRAQVAGLSCGAAITAEGTVLTDHHRLIVLNPFYSLL
jgi:hypothetical protein